MMKRLVASLVLLGIVLAPFADVRAQTKRRRHKSRIVTVVLSTWEPEPGSLLYALTRGLPSVTRVEVGHIEPAFDKSTGNEVMLLDKVRVRVLASKTLTDNAAKHLAQIWRRLKRSTANACFVPAYWFKFYSGDRQLCETIVCFGCRNIMLSDGSFWGFDKDGLAGVRLLKELKALFPPIAQQLVGPLLQKRER